MAPGLASIGQFIFDVTNWQATPERLIVLSTLIPVAIYPFLRSQNQPIEVWKKNNHSLQLLLIVPSFIRLVFFHLIPFFFWATGVLPTLNTPIWVLPLNGCVFAAGLCLLEADQSKEPLVPQNFNLVVTALATALGIQFPWLVLNSRFLNPFDDRLSAGNAASLTEVFYAVLVVTAVCTVLLYLDNAGYAMSVYRYIQIAAYRFFTHRMDFSNWWSIVRNTSAAVSRHGNLRGSKEENVQRKPVGIVGSRDNLKLRERGRDVLYILGFSSTPVFLCYFFSELNRGKTRERCV